jgi:uncharacterized cupin superfamily protein
MDELAVLWTKLSHAHFSVKEVVAMVGEVRRVVMGERPGGGSGFNHIETVDPMKIGKERVWHVWGWDRIPTLPFNPSAAYVARSWAPPAGGMRLSATRFSADQVPRSEVERATEAALQALASAEPCGRCDDPGRPGMHRTDSIEIGVVVAGEVRVEAENGESVTLRPGDVYVQNGAMHRWCSDEDASAHVVFISFGVRRDD